jgi:DNA (cytosine-5)-methyltransferase 1
MGRQDSESETLIPTNRCGEGQAMTFGAQNSSYQGDGVSVDFCPTLDKSKTPGVLTASAVRRLTPTECERLQGFPDGYTAIRWRYTPIEKCPDGPRYKALGNSMAVPVMRWIGERIQKVEETIKRTIT